MKVVVINSHGLREEYDTPDDAIMALAKKVKELENELSIKNAAIGRVREWAEENIIHGLHPRYVLKLLAGNVVKK